MSADTEKDIFAASQEQVDAQSLSPSQRYVRPKPDSSFLPQDADIGNLEFADIIDVPMIQSLMECFYELVHIPMAIIDTKGRLLVGVGWQDVCTKFHRLSAESGKNCMESDTQLMTAISPKEFKLYRCKNNVWNVVTPIVLDDWQCGNLWCGQFFFDDEPMDYELFRAQAKQYEFDEKAYLAAVQALPRLSREAVDRGTAFMMRLAQMLSHMGLNNLKLARSVQATKQAEARAAERETWFHTLFNTIPLSVALIDPQTLEFVQFNDAAAENLGYTREEFAKLTVHDIEAVYSPQQLDEMVARTSPSSHVLPPLETKHRTKSGEVRDVIVYVRFMYFDGRRVENCVWEDVTEKKAAEAALIQSERRATERETWFHTLFDNIPLSAVLIDPYTREFLQFNDAASNELGYTREEFSKLTIDDIDAVHSTQELEKHFEERLRSGELATYERKHRTKSGAIRDVVVYSRYLNVNGQIMANAVWCDVTEKKLAEAALLQSEKLASVGRMAATVAHEINNPLAVVTNCIYLAGSNSNLPPEVREYLATAERELHRVAHIARRTLGFYRETTKPVVVEIRTLVDEVVELYDPKFTRKDIRLKVEHNGHRGGTVAFAGEIRQVISNLLTNAIDASKPKGMIRVRTSRVTLNGRSYVRVTVADAGSGISMTNRSHIFEPFFTTKKEVGTGLGLWVSYEIVQKHKGKIRLRSVDGKGSVFSVFLPSPANKK